MDWRNVSFDWNQARAFVVTAREGSYSAAARALGTTQPTIGRQVAALEEHLGVTLFERVGRGIALTAVGLQLVDHVGAMADAAMRVSLVAAGQSTSLEGIVAITASEVISAHLLPPIVKRIREEHPGIEVEISASNLTEDLRRREADIAVRGYRPTDPELFARKVRDGRAWPYATPGYLERIGNPTSLEAFSDAEFFGFDRTEVMIEGLRHLGLHLSPRNFPIVTSNHLVMWEMAKQGLGICIMMEEVGDAEPLVQRISDDIPPFPVPIWLTSHRELRTSQRLRVVFDLLYEGLSEG